MPRKNRFSMRVSTRATYRRAARWLRLHGFPCEYGLLCRTAGSACQQLALLRRIRRLHQIGYSLRSLLELPSAQFPLVTAGQGQCLPSVKMLQWQESLASAGMRNWLRYAFQRVAVRVAGSWFQYK